MGSSVQAGAGKDQTTSTPNLAGAAVNSHQLAAWGRGKPEDLEEGRGPGLRLCPADAPPSEARTPGLLLLSHRLSGKAVRCSCIKGSPWASGIRKSLPPLGMSLVFSEIAKCKMLKDSPSTRSLY